MTGRPAPSGPTACVLLAAAVLAACGEDAAPPPPPPPASERPVDDLEEGELAESSASAFGLPLPARMTVAERSDLRVIALGGATLEEVANFVRDRIEAREVVTGPSKTTFDGIKVKNPRPREVAPPANEGGREMIESIKVEVAREGGRTRMVVTRVLSPKALPALTEDQRWERLGLTKDGKPANPKKFE